MNDKAIELLEQYEIEVLRTRKGRGAIVCDTDKGCLIFREYSGSQDRIGIQDRLLKQIADAGQVCVEAIIPNREGSLLVRDTDGTGYVLKTWQEGRECSVHDRHECVEAVRLLARLHKNMELPGDMPNLPVAFSPEKEYDKHNKELKRVRKYLQQKGQKNWFETSLRKAFDPFMEQAFAVTEQWREYCRSFGEEKAAQDSCRKEGRVAFCHGDYQYHNILQGMNGWFVVNFEKCLCDDPVRDLYLLLRKLLEKSNWSVALGEELLAAYEKERSISAKSWIDLYYRLAYPEKFWKIVNFYYNSGKAWIPGKNQEKLERVIEQEKEKQHFLDETFRHLDRLRR
ncbi:MAG: phosphotransferase [Lachnospiraceae bacterium]|nr:phosphotransferase [uncultured Acetatifactor sp.]MCI9220267.1 phosphotransferase [Lachnospiraceae bacterium]